MNIQTKHRNPELMQALLKLEASTDITKKESLLIAATREHIQNIEGLLATSESNLVAFKSVIMIVQSNCRHLVKEPYFDDVTKIAGEICENCMKVFPPEPVFNG